MPTDTNGIISMYTISYIIDDGSEKSIIVTFNGENVSHTHVK